MIKGLERAVFHEARRQLLAAHPDRNEEDPRYGPTGKLHGLDIKAARYAFLVLISMSPLYGIGTISDLLSLLKQRVPRSHPLALQVESIRKNCASPAEYR